MIRWLTTILLGLGAGYAAAVRLSVLQFGRRPNRPANFRVRFQATDRSEASHPPMSTSWRGSSRPCARAGRSGLALGLDERGTARDDVDYGLSCLARMMLRRSLGAGLGANLSDRTLQRAVQVAVAGGVPAGVLIDCISQALFLTGLASGMASHSKHQRPGLDRPDQRH